MAGHVWYCLVVGHVRQQRGRFLQALAMQCHFQHEGPSCRNSSSVDKLVEVLAACVVVMLNLCHHGVMVSLFFRASNHRKANHTLLATCNDKLLEL